MDDYIVEQEPMVKYNTSIKSLFTGQKPPAGRHCYVMEECQELIQNIEYTWNLKSNLISGSDLILV